MSVIYRSLRKLKQADATAGGMERGRFPGGNSLDEKEGELPIAVKVTLGVLPLVVLGLGAAGYWWYAQQGRMMTADEGGGQRNTLTVESAFAGSVADAATTPIVLAAAGPAPTTHASAVDATGGPVATTPAMATTTVAPAPTTAAPTTAAPTTAAGAVAAVAGRNADAGKPAAMATEADAARLDDLLGGIGVAPPKKGDANTTGKDQGTNTRRENTPGGAMGSASGTQAPEHQSDATARSVSPSGKSKKRDVNDTPSGDVKQEDAFVSGEIQKKTVATVHAISRVRRALAAGNNEDVNAGLNNLVAMKGENNIFVMKMQAYLLMRQGKYAQAGGLLEDVLRKKQNDLDAARNMVIVELKTNRRASAQERLKDLLRRYPDDRHLQDLRQYLD